MHSHRRGSRMGSIASLWAAMRSRIVFIHFCSHRTTACQLPQCRELDVSRSHLDSF